MRAILIISLGSGLLMGLATSPINAWYLAWLALIPLWVFLRQTRRFKPLIPLAWGIGYHGLALSWITGIHPMTWLGVPWLNSLVIALLCWLTITLWGSLLVLAWSWGIYRLCRLSKSTVLLIVWGVTLWCGLEFLWSTTPLWWSTLSYTQSPSNLIILQLSRISGPTTVTGAIVLVNALLAEAWLIGRHHPKKATGYLATGVLIFLGLHLGGWWQYQQGVVVKSSESLKIGIIQGNIPNEIKLYSPGWRQAIAGYTQGYTELAATGADIVLTPETALPFFSVEDPFYQAILEYQLPVWLGTFARSEQGLTNSLLTITDSGEIYSRYDKVKLVPLGEYIPLSKVLGRWIERLSPLDARLIKGKPRQILDTPWGRVTAAICYDSAFAEHFRWQTAQGGKLIISAANNAHYSQAMPAQHHAQDTMRAIESDRWLVRATNTGYSSLINPRGETVWLSELNKYQLYLGTVYLRSTDTLYVSWGDWLLNLFLVISLVALLVNFIQLGYGA